MLEDTAILARDVPNTKVAPRPEVIRSVISVILSKWSEGNGISQLQRYLGKDAVRIPALDFGRAIQCCNDGTLRTWIGPLALFDTQVGVAGAESPDKQGLFDPNSMKDTELRVTQFFEQQIAYIDNEFIRRKQIVDYARNKGGAHLSDGKTKERLEQFRLLQGVVFDRRKNTISLSGGAHLEEAQNSLSSEKGAYDSVQLVVLDTARRFVNGIDGISDKLEMLALSGRK